MIICMANGFEKKIIEAFDELEIPEKHIGSLNAYLSMMKGRDVPTYEHGIRVGLKGREVGEFIHHGIKPLFYSGLLHDFGKIFTNPNSLNKNTNFGPKEMKEVKKHSEAGHSVLVDIHPYVAAIVVRVHLFQKKPYPKDLPKLPKRFSKADEVMINYYARLISLIDSHDALITRKNEKWGKPARLPTKTQAKKRILELNQDQEYFINELYKSGIF